MITMRFHLARGSQSFCRSKNPLITFLPFFEGIEDRYT